MRHPVFRYRANGNPTPTVVWRRGGEKIMAGMERQGSRYTAFIALHTFAEARSGPCRLLCPSTIVRYESQLAAPLSDLGSLFYCLKVYTTNNSFIHPKGRFCLSFNCVCVFFSAIVSYAKHVLCIEMAEYWG